MDVLGKYGRRVLKKVPRGEDVNMKNFKSARGEPANEENSRGFLPKDDAER